MKTKSTWKNVPWIGPVVLCCQVSSGLSPREDGVSRHGEMVQDSVWNLREKRRDSGGDGIRPGEAFSPIAMLWGLAKLIGGRAPSGHRQSWWADGVPVMF